MNPQIEKLQKLLARVQTRAVEPRAVAKVSPPAAAASLAAAPPPVAQVAPPPVAQVAPRIAPATKVAPEPDPLDRAFFESVPPPEPALPSAPPPAAAVQARTHVPEDMDITAVHRVPAIAHAPVLAPEPSVVEVDELPEPVVEVSREELTGHTSDERLIAAPRAEEDLVSISEPVIEAAAETQTELETPISSRRPVLPAVPDEREALNRPTPPPESGKQMSAAPLPDFDGDQTGVHALRSTPPDRLTRVPGESEMPAPPPALIGASTRPALVATDNVAEWIGKAQSFAPENFGALFDASLSL